MRNETEMEPLFFSLKEYVENKYNLTVFNITYEKIKIKLHRNSYKYGMKYELIVHIQSIQERESMQNKILVDVPNISNAFSMINDESKQKDILDMFISLCKKYSYPLKVDPKNIWVDYYFSFPADYMSFIVNKIQSPTKKKILSQYGMNANIWEIVVSGPGVHVLYYTEDSKENNMITGISDKIKEEFFSAIKEVDDLNLYRDDYIVFDTKENIDNNYQGSIYYYLR
jgi:hypothetical protein